MTHPATADGVRRFVSDNWAGMCPEALDALTKANHGHVPGYGSDAWTAQATQRMQDVFETDCAVYFVMTGTAANALALAAMCQSYHSVICHADAHIQTDECGCPEFTAHGIKLVALPGRDGKLDPLAIKQAAERRRDVHSNKPRVLSISQCTEVGTVYTVAEMQALGAAARELGLLVHVDGARFANALATLEVPAKAITWQAGVDALCFGGTKNGMAAGDAIVFFNRALAVDFDYRRKQAGQLLSKMRFVTAPWTAMLASGAWLRNARHANAMARQLEQELRAFPELQIVYPVQANAVFVTMPQRWKEGLDQRGWQCYTIGAGERLMCAWDTQAEDIAAFVRDVRAVAAAL